MKGFVSGPVWDSGERPPGLFVYCWARPNGLGDFLLSSPIPFQSCTFQRLKAKLLESLCFYPPICSHLAGLGGGAVRALAVLSAGKCPNCCCRERRMSPLSLLGWPWAQGQVPVGAQTGSCGACRVVNG